MQIFIEPSDVLLFRDGRPFSAGEGHRAKSVFPPYPNTIQGAIRSKVLAERCGNYQQYRDGCLNCSKQTNCTIPDEIGRPSQDERGNYGAMHLKAALVAKYYDSELTTYFPVPADVVQVKNKNKTTDKPELRFLQPLKNNLPGQNDFSCPLLPLWTSENTPVEAAQGYLCHQDLGSYLLSEKPNCIIITADELYKFESRLGIEVDNIRQATEEGKLYQTEFVRCLENIGLYIEVEGIKQLSLAAQEGGLIAIGGENRTASYINVYKINWDNFDDQLIEKLNKSFRFKLYLATPTIFRQGWLPKWINSQNFQGEYKGIKVTLKAAAISRYQTIGGWDVAYNRPKPTYRAVSAGSVYYFETKANPEEILDAFHWQNLADDEQNAQIGFGLSLVGTWDYYNITKE